MFRIKVCGITTIDDAVMVARAGADAVGLNFYPKSVRYVQLKQAQRIAEALPKLVVKVGVFVNASHEEVRRTADEVGLDLIQLHGDESAGFLNGLDDRPVIRAFRLGEAGLKPIADYLQECRKRGCLPGLVLIDSHTKGAYGGTGTVADWSVVSNYPSEDWHPPLVLAGGLGPGNVAGSVAAVKPAAVDTASGVESQPGRKDEQLVRQFVEAARGAFGES